MNNMSLYMEQLDQISKQMSEEDSNLGIRENDLPLTRKEMEELRIFLSEQKDAYEREHRTFLSEELKRRLRP